MDINRKLTSKYDENSPWKTDSKRFEEFEKLLEKNGVDAKELRQAYLSMQKKRESLLKSLYPEYLKDEPEIPSRDFVYAVRSSIARAIVEGERGRVAAINAGLRKYVQNVERFGKLEAQSIRKLAGDSRKRAGFTADSATAQVKLKEVKDDDLLGRVRREILEADLDASIKLLDLDVAQGVTIAARYKWEFEPSYKKGYHTRVDRWKIKDTIKVGDIVKDAVSGEEVPIYLNLIGHNEIIFARQFKSMLKAASALPYTPLKIPFTVKKARDLEPGDFVSLPVRLQMITSLNIPLPSSEFVGGIGLNPNVDISYVVEGASRFKSSS